MRFIVSEGRKGMCNAFSDVYSLFNDGRELCKGNWTKLPEVAVEANNTLHALGRTNGKLGKGVKNAYDSFVKGGFEKSNTDGVNQDALTFIDGMVDCYRNYKASEEKSIKKHFLPFVCGFTAQVGAEMAMESALGSKGLGKFSKTLSNVLTKPFASGKGAQKVKDLTTAVISGFTYQAAADFVGNKVTDYVEKKIN